MQCRGKAGAGVSIPFCVFAFHEQRSAQDEAGGKTAESQVSYVTDGIVLSNNIRFWSKNQKRMKS